MSLAAKRRLARGTITGNITSIGEENHITTKEVCHVVCVSDTTLQLEARVWMPRVIDTDLITNRWQVLLTNKAAGIVRE